MGEGGVCFIEVLHSHFKICQHVTTHHLTRIRVFCQRGNLPLYIMKFTLSKMFISFFMPGASREKSRTYFKIFSFL